MTERMWSLPAGGRPGVYHLPDHRLMGILTSAILMDQTRPGILLWNQTTVVSRQGQTLCALNRTHPDTFIDICCAEGSQYKHAAAAGSHVSMVAAACLLVAKVFVSHCWNICLMSVKMPERWPWVPPQRCQNKRLKIQRKLSIRVHTQPENQSGNEDWCCSCTGPISSAVGL